MSDKELKPFYFYRHGTRPWLVFTDEDGNPYYLCSHTGTGVPSTTDNAVHSGASTLTEVGPVGSFFHDLEGVLVKKYE